LARTGDIKFFTKALTTDSLHAVDEKGCSLLHKVILENRPVKFIKVLVDKGLSVNITDSRGDTPLHLAASLKFTHQVKKLLELGADPSIQNLAGKTPIEVTKSKKIKKIFAEKKETEAQSKEKDSMEINSNSSL
jgi:ankyrin repeat protein